MRKEKFGAQKKVGNRSRTVATPSADTVHDSTKSRSGDRLVKLRVVHRVQGTPHGVPQCRCDPLAESRGRHAWAPAPAVSSTSSSPGAPVSSAVVSTANSAGTSMS